MIKGKRPGRVIRVSKDVESLLRAEFLKPRDSYDNVLRRILGRPDKRKRLPRDILFALRSDLHTTEEEVRGEAIKRAVRMKLRKNDVDLRLVRVRRL